MSDPTYRIAAIPGDGVGPEVTGARGACSTRPAQAFGFDIAWTDIAAGGNAIDAYGVAIRPEDVTPGRRGATRSSSARSAGPRWDDPTATVRPEQASSRSGAGSGCTPTCGR